MTTTWVHIDAIASRIQKRLDAGFVTDEGRVSLNLIRDEVHKVRAWYMGELMKMRWSIPEQYYQRVCCLKVECEEVECEGEKSGEVNLKVKLPALVGKVGRHAIRFLGSSDGSLSFTWKSSNSTFSAYFPFGGKSKEPWFSLAGSYAILHNSPTPNLAYLCVNGLFSNPLDPLIIDCADREKYPICGDDLQVIEDQVVKNLSIIYSRPPDLHNDATPTIQ